MPGERQETRTTQITTEIGVPKIETPYYRVTADLLKSAGFDAEYLGESPSKAVEETTNIHIQGKDSALLINVVNSAIDYLDANRFSSIKGQKRNDAIADCIHLCVNLLHDYKTATKKK